MKTKRHCERKARSGKQSLAGWDCRVVVPPPRNDGSGEGLLAPPSSFKVIGRSVFQRSVRQGVPSRVHSSCKPPLSVNMTRALLFKRSISK